MDYSIRFFKIPFFFSSFRHAHTGQDASLLHCLCVWIITSLDASATSEVMGHMDGMAESHEWGLPDLALLWQWLLKRQKARILLHGFQLFLEVSWPGSLAQPSEAHMAGATEAHVSRGWGQISWSAGEGGMRKSQNPGLGGGPETGFVLCARI